MHKLYKIISYFLIPLIKINTFIRILNKKEDKIRYKERFGFTNLQKIRLNISERLSLCQTGITLYSAFQLYTLVSNRINSTVSHPFVSFLLLRQIIEAPTIGLTNYVDPHQ